MKNNKLHDYMEVHKISLLDLSKLTGIPKATIHNIKSGDLHGVKVGQLMAISKALKLPLQYFFDESDHPQVQEPVGEYKKMSDLVIETQKKMIKNLEEELSRLSAEKNGSKCV